MKNSRSLRHSISPLAVLVALIVGASSSMAQSSATAQGYAMVQPNAAKNSPTNFYIKIGGLQGPAKGYTNKGILCRGFNNMVKIPDRLKVGTYTIQIVDANGKPVPNMSGATLNVTSKPRDAATGIATGKRMHQPMIVKKVIDNASPILFSVAAADVDNDGMLDVMLSLTGQVPGTPVTITPNFKN